MATTVDNTFTKFNADVVNLDRERTVLARSSRDWLIDRLIDLPTKDTSFPKLYDGMHVRYGSFARNTKIRPLDDIDLLLTFSGEGTWYNIIIYGQNYTLTVPDSAIKLKQLCNPNGTLNSIKLVNCLKNAVGNIEHYRAAEIHRQQEAVTLQLSSYEWNFDIVPAFYTDTGYYIIPDGNGGWKATDPRIDQKRTNDINQKHKGKALQLIRTLKFWNVYRLTPQIPPYVFENIILNWLSYHAGLSNYIDWDLREFWNYLKTAIYQNVPDPKNFQGELNTLSFNEQMSISSAASLAYQKACEAYDYESNQKNHEKAINKWREIFGNAFPKYE